MMLIRMTAAARHLVLLNPNSIVSIKQLSNGKSLVRDETGDTHEVIETTAYLQNLVAYALGETETKPAPFNERQAENPNLNAGVV